MIVFQKMLYVQWRFNGGRAHHRCQHAVWSVSSHYVLHASLHTSILLSLHFYNLASWKPTLHTNTCSKSKTIKNHIESLPIAIIWKPSCRIWKEHISWKVLGPLDLDAESFNSWWLHCPTPKSATTCHGWRWSIAVIAIARLERQGLFKSFWSL